MRWRQPWTAGWRPRDALRKAPPKTRSVDGVWRPEASVGRKKIEKDSLKMFEKRE